MRLDILTLLKIGACLTCDVMLFIGTFWGETTEASHEKKVLAGLCLGFTVYSIGEMLFAPDQIQQNLAGEGAHDVDA